MSGVRQYVANVGLFLDFVAAKLEWGDLAGSVVFDVGCGNPRVKLADLLVERYPDLRKVFAIDNQLHLIRYLRCKKPHPSIEHLVGDIERRSDVSRFVGVVDKVLSSHCFHMVRDQAGAFSNVFSMLRGGGEAAFLFCHSSGYADWFTDITQNIQWNKYFNGSSPVIPVTQFMRSLTGDYYTKLLEDVGFQVVYCEKDKIRVPYPSDQECKDGLVKLSNCSFSVPEESREEFESYLFDTFLKHNEREGGRPCQVSYYVTALVRKPLKE